MSGLGSIIAMLIQRSMANANAEKQKAIQDQQLKNMQMQYENWSLDYAHKKAEFEKEKAKDKWLKSAMESMMPVEPEAGGVVPPGTPASAGPMAGLKRSPAGMAPQDLLTIMAMQSGDPKLIASTLQKQAQPNWDEILFGGGTKAPIGTTGLAQNLIKRIGQGDPQAIATATRIKLGGGPDLLAGGKQATPSYKPRTMYDPDTGREYTARWDERAGQFEMTPTGKIKNFGTETPTKWKDIDIIDQQGVKKRYWYREDQPPMMGLPIEPPATQMTTVETPGGGKQAVRVGKYGKPGEAITTAPEKGMTPDQAGRLQLSQMGFNSVKNVVKLFINEDGTINRSNILKFASPLRIGVGRDIYSNMKAAIEAPIRAATGAVINVEELANYMDMYGPSPLDSDELIKDKLRRLYRFNTGYAAKIDPTGKLLERVGQELKIPEKKTPKLKKEKKSNFEIIEVK